jgi:pimeloyl-ACP methyl ester carboxylesterase
MLLHFSEMGEGEPLVILHGLYGSGDNWISIARDLSVQYRVILVDQRNHGKSPHCEIMDYASMAKDLIELLNTLSIEKVIVLGHSMGGKTAMVLSLAFPERVKKLIVVDISPFGQVAFSNDILEGHKLIVEGMTSMPLHSITSRKEAEDHLAKYVKSSMVRQFLLKSLKRSSPSGFVWQLNLEVIANNLEFLMAGVMEPISSEKIDVPTLFIRGDNSAYLPNNLINAIGNIFQHSQLISIPNAGHWVHAEQPQLFLTSVLTFLND